MELSLAKAWKAFKTLWGLQKKHRALQERYMGQRMASSTLSLQVRTSLAGGWGQSHR